MRKTFEKGTAVPGAQLITDPETRQPARDKKGRPIWAMPNQTAVVKHTKRSFKGKGSKKVVIVEEVEVPVYRGADASLIRHMRADLRRKRRKEEARKSNKVAGAVAVSIPDDLAEELSDDEAHTI